MFFLRYLFEELIDTGPLGPREVSKRRQLLGQRNPHSERLQDRLSLGIWFGFLADYCRGEVLMYSQDRDGDSGHYHLNQLENIL